MQDSYDDTTPEEMVIDYGLLSVRKLIRRLEGRFCAPCGQGFGCGATGEISQGDELTLNIGANLGVSLGAATKFTASQKWSYKAERCEYCRPRACIESAALEVWEHTHFPYPWGVTGRRTVFRSQSPYPDIYANCTAAPQCPGCTRELVPPSSPAAPVRELGRISPAVVAEVTSIGLASGSSDLDASELRPSSEAVEELARALFMPPVEDEEADIGVLGSDGLVHWLRAAGRREGPVPAIAITPLERGLPTTTAGGTAESPPFLPILAFGPPGITDFSVQAQWMGRLGEIVEELEPLSTVLVDRDITAIWAVLPAPRTAQPGSLEVRISAEGPDFFTFGGQSSLLA